MASNMIDDRRKGWAYALTLPGQPDLQASLVAELAEYLDQPVAQVKARCQTASATLAQAWREAAPATPEAIAMFYQQTDIYLYDLTWWHALAADDSALVQVEALECARAHFARTALDFGSGVGSLGLLLAQHGLAVTLAEINPRLNDYARWRFERRGLAARCLDLRADPLPANAFDFIAAVDVFEHLPDPGTTLTALASALRPGGVLFIHLPPAPDPLRPMHLWHDPDILSNHLAPRGLWLERADGPTLVLRQGEGPRYVVNPGLELLPDEHGGTLLSAHPLLAIRLNPQAFGVLARLDRPCTAVEVAAATGLPAADVTAFLDGFARRRLLASQPPLPPEWPTVSVIIPAQNRPDQTRACVESILALDYPPDRLEVIVVDDASDPPLAPTLAGLPVRILQQETNIGQSAARNLGATEARGDLLAFIDNDCTADPHWLRALVLHFGDPRVGIVGGRVIAPLADGLVAAFEASRSPLDMGIRGGEIGPGNGRATYVVAPYLPTCNLVARREMLLRLGGFDTRMALGEDVDFVWRARRAGKRAVYVPEGQVVHYHRTQLGALLRRRADYGSSEADLQRRHPEGRRVMVLPLTTGALLAALVAWPAAWPISAALGILALLGLGLEFTRKLRRLRALRARLPVRQIVGAVLREHGAAAYFLGANVVRYYSLPLLAVGLLWPPLLLAAFVLFLIPPIADYRRLRPRLSLPVFVGLYWLEMAAYQVGVWRGCWKWRTLRPLMTNFS